MENNFIKNKISKIKYFDFLADLCLYNNKKIISEFQGTRVCPPVAERGTEKLADLCFKTYWLVAWMNERIKYAWMT